VSRSSWSLLADRLPSSASALDATPAAQVVNAYEAKRREAERQGAADIPVAMAGGAHAQVGKQHRTQEELYDIEACLTVTAYKLATVTCKVADIHDCC
jgi:hypothetical protein